MSPVHRARLLPWTEVERPGWVPTGDPARRPAPLRAARVALCHEWTLKKAGSEKVAAAIADVIQPDAVFTLAARSETVQEVFGPWRVYAPTPGLSGWVQSRWDRMLPLLHAGWSSLDLSEFDVVVTSSHASVNALRAGPASQVISYVHTPMRYAWAWREELGRVPGPLRPVWPAVAKGLQALDRRSSRKVDRFVANSEFVAARVRAAYGRDATVIHPPVDTAFYHPPPDGRRRDDYFLVAGRLVDYKRTDIAVDAARVAEVPIVVAGDGPAFTALRDRAGPGCRFVPSPTDAELRRLYQRARALVFPGVEDFGISPVEAMACGTPVLCQRRGGVSETVVDGKTGRILDEQTVAAFAASLASWPDEWSRAACRSVAERFAPPVFVDALREVFE